MSAFLILGKCYVINEQVSIKSIFNMFGFHIYQVPGKFYLSKESISTINGVLQRTDEIEKLYTHEISSNLSYLKIFDKST